MNHAASHGSMYGPLGLNTNRFEITNAKRGALLVTTILCLGMPAAMASFDLGASGSGITGPFGCEPLTMACVMSMIGAAVFLLSIRWEQRSDDILCPASYRVPARWPEAGLSLESPQPFQPKRWQPLSNETGAAASTKFMRTGIVQRSSVVASPNAARALPTLQRRRADMPHETARGRNSVVVEGIPKMFRWLTDQYPEVMERAQKSLGREGIDVDNLYLDMNGIIHMCSHNDGEVSFMTDRERMKRVVLFTDKIIKLIKPRRTVFLAVDGVAPRAKMNQQRSRRFRSSADRRRLLETMIARGEEPLGASEKDGFDSNCITPGTQFMAALGNVLREWLEHQSMTDPVYANGLKIVFSGADVAGEGEHKIMDYIRDASQGAEADWDENLRHCFYGLDADLIMLSLVSHQPNFRLLREKLAVRHGWGRGRRGAPKDPLRYEWYDFEFLDVGGLREMLRLRFLPPVDVSSETVDLQANDAELERIVDDFVFVCALVGNDFLPTTPHLHIKAGGLNLLLNTYEDMRRGVFHGQYLTDKDEINLEMFELFAREIANEEPEYFHRRGLEEKNKAYLEMPSNDHDDSAAGVSGGGTGGYVAEYYRQKFGIAPDAADSGTDVRRQAVVSYIDGLRWVLHYYHYGCNAWDWYYPELYAPLMSDFYDLESLRPRLAEPSRTSEPVPPLTQLLSVLPPQSSRLLPPPYADLMVRPESPLAEAYPETFEVDPNGKSEDWEGIVQIPFIDEHLLNATLADLEVDSKLTKREAARNKVGKVHVFRGNGTPTMSGVSKGAGGDGAARGGRGGGRGRGRGGGRGWTGRGGSSKS